MTLYEFLLWIHILGAIVWVGSDTFIQIAMLRVQRSNNAVRVAGFAEDIGWVGQFVIFPVSVVLLLAGIGLLLVDGSPWSWGDPFVSVGLLVWVVAGATGAMYLVPRSGAYKASIEATGLDSPESRSVCKGLMIVSRVQLLLLMVVVFMMVVKLGS